MSRPSLIAGANAWFRARESERPEAERLLADPWASLLVDRSPELGLIHLGARLFARGKLSATLDALQAAHCIRHRVIDRLLLREVEAGRAQQVVVVGAGYDMRPLRFAGQLSAVRWVEVDHPATQGRKLKRLGTLDVGTPPLYVAADLTRVSLADALLRARLDPGAPTVFVLEGLVHYLQRPSLEKLLRDVGSGFHRVQLIVSFIRPSVYARHTPTLARMVRALREIPRLALEPAELKGLCTRAGLTQWRSWDIGEQIEEFAPMAAHRRPPLAQDVGWASSGESVPEVGEL
jgi:methyltransferase (TIGR00027 family)